MTARPYGIAPAGYRLPDATRLGPVTLQIADLARSIAFYEDIVGLQATRTSPTTATLTAHEDDVPLVHLHERAGAAPVPTRGRLGLYHFAMLVPDRAALGRVVARLASVNARVGMADHAVSEALYLTDPDGLGIEIYADRPRETWRADAARQLYMTTAPLDVRGLLDAAGNSRGQGLPVGTTIGHVHLHVGDLPRAEAFYHSALGFEKTVWEYPGALFFAAGGYHHHLGTNTWATGGPALADQARLLSWDIVLPSTADVAAAADSVRAAGYRADAAGDAAILADPWGTTLRLTPA